MPEVSVVVPVYNVAPFLSQCIDSLINQTLKEIEIILIDDGSTDYSGVICDEYEQRDSRIHVIHKANEGLSAARNDGISASSAPYIMFVDSDDWVNNDFCELPFRTALRNNADLVLFAYNRITDNKTKIRVTSNMKSGLLTEEQALSFNTHYAPAVWLGLYHRSLFSITQFPVGKIHEDTGTTYKLIHDANKIFFLDNFLYNYRSGRPGSIITSPWTREHHDLLEMLLQRVRDLIDWGYQGLALNDAMYVLIRGGCSDQTWLVSFLKKTHSYTDLSWKRKIMLVFLRLSPMLFDCVCVIMGRRLKKQTVS